MDFHVPQKMWWDALIYILIVVILLHLFSYFWHKTEGLILMWVYKLYTPLALSTILSRYCQKLPEIKVLL